MKKWETLSSEVKFENPWWSYHLNTFRLPNGKEGEYHFVHTAGSVMIVPLRSDGKIQLVRQYRYLIDNDSLEFPAGGVKEGEHPDAIARKELIEETGFDGTLEHIGWFTPFNGVGDEKCQVYLATELAPSYAFSADETEDFELVDMAPEEIDEAIRANRLNDGMTMAAWALARSRVIR